MSSTPSTASRSPPQRSASAIVGIDGEAELRGALRALVALRLLVDVERDHLHVGRCQRAVRRIADQEAVADVLRVRQVAVDRGDQRDPSAAAGGTSAPPEGRVARRLVADGQVRRRRGASGPGAGSPRRRQSARWSAGCARPGRAPRPVRNIFSMWFTSGLKKFASVVRAGGIGRYICVERTVGPPVEARGEVEVLAPGRSAAASCSFRPSCVLVAVGDRVLHQPAASRRGVGKTWLKPCAGRRERVAAAQRGFEQLAATRRPPARRPSRSCRRGRPARQRDAGLAARAALDHALQRLQRVEVVAVDAAVADADGLSNPRPERHLHRRRPPRDRQARPGHHGKSHPRVRCRTSPSPTPSSRTGACR